MKDATQSIYPEQRPPATNILNQAEYPIDGRWCSIGITEKLQVTLILEKKSHRTTEYCG